MTKEERIEKTLDDLDYVLPFLEDFYYLSINDCWFHDITIVNRITNVLKEYKQELEEELEELETNRKE